MQYNLHCKFLNSKVACHHSLLPQASLLDLFSEIAASQVCLHLWRDTFQVDPVTSNCTFFSEQFHNNLSKFLNAE